MATTLQIVQHYFPHVQTVKDAEQEVKIEVTPRDNSSARVKNHTACAMAVACKRAYHADGVIVSVSVAYIIKGNTAIRYRLPESIAREVVSFDRKGGFSPGLYKMLKPKEGHTIGERQGTEKEAEPENGNRKHVRKKRDLIHYTEGIRAVLGTKSSD